MSLLQKDPGIPLSTACNVFSPHGTVRYSWDVWGGETKSIRELVEGWWELQKNTMCRSELKADLEQSGVMVSTRNIRRTPNQDGLNERQLRWTPLLKDRIPRLDWSVLKQAPDKLQSLWQNVWTGDTEIELCRQAEKYTLPTVKHHGSVMLWDCFCCLWWKETYSVLNESRNQRITGAFLQQNGLPSERVESKIKGPPKHKKYGWTFLKKTSISNSWSQSN